ncbi:MAG: alkyl sulfatase dimerization domain-containing protein [Candidatus Bipolaricaulota bacterium]
MMTSGLPTWVASNLVPDWGLIPSRPSSEELAPGFFLFAGFSNNYVLDTGDGLCVIDPGHERMKDAFYEAVRSWRSSPVHTVAYTHGHVDHVTGFGRFLEEGERPQIVAQQNCVQRFQRYQLTHGFNQHINRRQTGNPNLQFPREFLAPTLTFRDSLTQRIGDLELIYRAVKGETDDYCTIWIPSKRILFVGDMATWKVPNSGNPLKVQRYPVEWAAALEEMAELGAEWLCPGHDLVLRGADNIRTFLLDQAAYLRSLITQVLDGMNTGKSYDDILHTTQPDPELANKPHIRAVYNHPQFIVRDLLRYWGGWWDGEGATLLPVPQADQAQEIVRLAAGTDQVIDRARGLVADGNFALACHLADWVTNASPESPSAQQLKREVYQSRAEHESFGMARGFFLTEVADAESAMIQTKGAVEGS